MKRRTICPLLAGVMALSLLSGCAGSQPNTPDLSDAGDALNSFAAAVENGDEDAAQATLDAADGTKTATEQGIYTYPEHITVMCDGEIVILIDFFADLPGEEGTTYRLRDLPVYDVTVRANANFDSALTFMGSVGDIRNMGQQDVEALLDASTSKECEEKLAELIQQMKAEITEAKRFAAEGKWEEVMALAGQKKARGTRNAETDYQEKSITL